MRLCISAEGGGGGSGVGGVGEGGLSPDTSCSVFWRVSSPPKRKE